MGARNKGKNRPTAAINRMQETVRNILQTDTTNGLQHPQDTSLKISQTDLIYHTSLTQSAYFTYEIYNSYKLSFNTLIQQHEYRSFENIITEISLRNDENYPIQNISTRLGCMITTLLASDGFQQIINPVVKDPLNEEMFSRMLLTTLSQITIPSTIGYSDMLAIKSTKILNDGQLVYVDPSISNILSTALMIASIKTKLAESVVNILTPSSAKSKVKNNIRFFAKEIVSVLPLERFKMLVDFRPNSEGEVRKHFQNIYLDILKSAVSDLNKPIKRQTKLIDFHHDQ